KLAEGGFNRTFRTVARIPYSATVPKHFAVVSSVATMALLRSFGLPIPDAYIYLPAPNDAAGTECISMESVPGTDTWFDLGEREIISISRRLATLESKMMSIAFPAGGSLYYTERGRERLWAYWAGHHKRFCVGPDTTLPLWYGRRSQLDLDRGPCRPLSAFF
ncbi:hypothetical protein F5887DRAFT_889470, partial [Amanita rubescens]